MTRLIEFAINALFKNEVMFDIFRRIVHKNFALEKNIIRKEIDFNKISNVLDFGCGVGQYSVIFENKNYYGIDADEKCINYARKKFKGKFISSNNAALPFENNFFDVVLIINTFHHIHNSYLSPILEEIRRVIKNDGTAIVLDLASINSQPNIISKMMVKFDRGKFARDFTKIRPYFEKYFTVKKHNHVHTALYNYKEYVAVLSPN